MSRSKLGPPDVASLGLVVIAVVYTAAVLRLAWRTSFFAGDDIFGFWLARTLPFREFVRAPIDVHVVPLHRLVTYLLQRAFPMNLGAAIAVLSIFHAIGVAALYRVLETLRPSRANVALVAMYSVQVCLGAMFTWWTAGLHRLPYVAASVLTVFFYLKFRSTGSRSALLLAFACVVVALGFFSKGILIPVYLAFVEIALSAVSRSEKRSSRLFALALLAAPSVAYVLAWRALVAPPLRALNPDTALYVRLAARGTEIFGQGALGYWCDTRLSVRLSTGALWGAAIVLSTRREPRTLAAWLGLFSCIALNWILVALPRSRAESLGLGLILVDRYYFELEFLAIMFVGIVGVGVARRTAEAPVRSRIESLAAAVAPVIAVGALAANSYATFAHLSGLASPERRNAKRFMTNLQHDVSRLPADEKRPLALVDGPVPAPIVRISNLVRRQSELLTLMGVSVAPSQDGRYRVTSEGHLERIAPASRPKP